jgi:hypothetical protein
MREQRMPVRVRLGDRGGADGGAAPGAVVDDDGLPNLSGNMIEHGAWDEVAGAAGRERHNHPHGLCGPALTESEVGRHDGDSDRDCRA